jgi:hypothetical protein
MADVVVDDISQSSFINKETIGNEDTCCYNCELLKLKLHEVSSELNSAREIIKILQEQESSIQRSLEKPQVPQKNPEERQASTEDPYTTWTNRLPGRKFTRRNVGRPKQEVFPIHVNRYNILRTLIEPQTVDLPSTHKTKTTTKINSEKSNKKCSANCRKCKNKWKIIIIGDSHAKGCAANIKQSLGKTAVVTGYVSPGSKLDNITNMANNEINKPTKNDTVVIWGGANDISKHESGKGLTHLLNFVKSCTNTNVIIIGALKRHDLSKPSCVNEEVDKFNQQLCKTIRVFEYIKVIDSIVSRECYTKRVLHFNSGGKEQMAHRIIDQFKSLEVINTHTPPFPYHGRKCPQV